QSTTAGATRGAAAVTVPAPPAQAQARSSAEPQSIAELIEPKRVKTVSVRPDGTVLPNDAPPPVAAQAPAAVRPPSPPAAKAATPKTAARVAAVPKPAAGSVARANPSQTTVAPKAKTAEGSSGTFAVQLAAPATEQEARELESRLLQKYSA